MITLAYSTKMLPDSGKVGPLDIVIEQADVKDVYYVLKGWDELVNAAFNRSHIEVVVVLKDGDEYRDVTLFFSSGVCQYVFKTIAQEIMDPIKDWNIRTFRLEHDGEHFIATLRKDATPERALRVEYFNIGWRYVAYEHGLANLQDFPNRLKFKYRKVVDYVLQYIQ